MGLCEVYSTFFVWTLQTAVIMTLFSSGVVPLMQSVLSKVTTSFIMAPVHSTRVDAQTVCCHDFYLPLGMVQLHPVP